MVKFVSVLHLEKYLSKKDPFCNWDTFEIEGFYGDDSVPRTYSFDLELFKNLRSIRVTNIVESKNTYVFNFSKECNVTFISNPLNPKNIILNIPPEWTNIRTFCHDLDFLPEGCTKLRCIQLTSTEDIQKLYNNKHKLNSVEQILVKGKYMENYNGPKIDFSFLTNLTCACLEGSMRNFDLSKNTSKINNITLNKMKDNYIDLSEFTELKYCILEYSDSVQFVNISNNSKLRDFLIMHCQQLKRVFVNNNYMNLNYELKIKNCPQLTMDTSQVTPLKYKDCHEFVVDTIKYKRGLGKMDSDFFWDDGYRPFSSV